MHLERIALTHSIGILPFELDACGLTPCHKSRLYWFNWKVSSEKGVEIANPLTSAANDYGRISFLLPCPPNPYLTPGWNLAGGCPHSWLPSPRHARIWVQLGLSSCQKQIGVIGKQIVRYPAYQYRFQRGLLHHKHGWRIPNINEREAMLGFPLEYTWECWPKSSRRQDGSGHENCRLELVSHASSVPVLAFLLKHLLAPLKLCDTLVLSEVQQRCQPGQSSQLDGFLSRPPWTKSRESKVSENDVNRVRKLGSLVSTKGTDVLLQSSTEPSQSYDRLRASVPSRLWKWKTACAWSWKRLQGSETEHINRLELRAVLTAVKWRILKAKQRQTRFLPVSCRSTS